MSSTERIVEDLTRLSDRSRDFVGDFLYAPLGIESSDTANAVTLYAILIGLAFVTYRLSRPAHKARISRAKSKYDLGRNV